MDAEALNKSAGVPSGAQVVVLFRFFVIEERAKPGCKTGKLLRARSVYSELIHSFRLNQTDDTKKPGTGNHQQKLSNLN